jgi:hypothetical protein
MCLNLDPRNAKSLLPPATLQAHWKPTFVLMRARISLQLLPWLRKNLIRHCQLIRPFPEAHSSHSQFQLISKICNAKNRVWLSALPQHHSLCRWELIQTGATNQDFKHKVFSRLLHFPILPRRRILRNRRDQKLWLANKSTVIRFLSQTSCIRVFLRMVKVLFNSNKKL